MAASRQWGECTEGRPRSENIGFVIRTCKGNIREPKCRSEVLLSKQQHAVGSWKGSPLASGGGFCGEFARQDIGNEPIRQLREVGAGGYCSNLFGDLV